MNRRVAAATTVALMAAGGVVVGSSSAATGDAQAPGWKAVGQAAQAAAVGGGQSRAAAADDGAGHASTDVRRIELLGTFQREEVVDLGEPGDTAGDFVVFEETLQRKNGGPVIGSDSVSCQTIVTSFRCSATFHIYGQGRIEIAGAFAGPGNVASVTGGTGAFEGVGGTFRFFGTDDPDVTRLAFRLVGGPDGHHH
jgi:hypothetical protein